MDAETATFSYDHVPYGSRVFPMSGPDQLATIATLHGLSPAPPERCRMLELGCGDGTNILSMAYVLPGSKFLGIDLSDVHIEKAKHAAKKLGLLNVEFLKADVSQVGTEEIGQFDFISAHGLFSWVPPAVRDAVLDLYSECLSENGVGYISYNVYPGARIREITWEMMRYHASRETDSNAIVARGRELLNFISKGAPDGPYKFALKEEADRLAERDDANVFHDDFAEHNHPIYFHEFDTLITDHGLTYLAEAEPDTKTLYNAHPQASAVIAQFAEGDRIKREQYLDFLSGRRFRSSVLRRAGNDVEDRPLSETLALLLFSSQLTCAPPSDLARDTVIAFSTPDGSSLEIGHPQTKMALQRMSDAYPQALSWNDVVGAAPHLNDEDLALLSSNLLDIWNLGLLSLRSFQPPIATIVSERPQASGFARFQLDSNCRGVTSLAGPNVEITQPLVRLLLQLLDGSRDQNELMNEMMTRVPNLGSSQEELREKLEKMVRGNLDIFLKLGLIEPN